MCVKFAADNWDGVWARASDKLWSPIAVGGGEVAGNNIR